MLAFAEFCKMDVIGEDIMGQVTASTGDSRRLGVEILSGNLGDISLISVLQLGQYERVSGWLDVRRRGYVVLRTGQVIDAQCGMLRATEALRELLFHQGGHFCLVRGEPQGASVIDNPTFAIMDAYRLRDEWRRLADAVLVPAHEAGWTPVGGLLDEVAALLDGRRSVAEVAAVVGSVTLLIDTLQDALALGLLRRTAVAAVEVEPVGDFYDLIDRAQAEMRGANYDVADRLLQRALSLRPEDRVALQNYRALSQRRRSA